jgi:hypothetical protein
MMLGRLEAPLADAAMHQPNAIIAVTGNRAITLQLRPIRPPIAMARPRKIMFALI